MGNNAVPILPHFDHMVVMSRVEFSEKVIWKLVAHGELADILIIYCIGTARMEFMELRNSLLLFSFWLKNYSLCVQIYLNGLKKIFLDILGRISNGRYLEQVFTEKL